MIGILFWPSRYFYKFNSYCIRLEALSGEQTELIFSNSHATAIAAATGPMQAPSGGQDNDYAMAVEGATKTPNTIRDTKHGYTSSKYT